MLDTTTWFEQRLLGFPRIDPVLRDDTAIHRFLQYRERSVRAFRCR